MLSESTAELPFVILALLVTAEAAAALEGQLCGVVNRGISGALLRASSAFPTIVYAHNSL